MIPGGAELVLVVAVFALLVLAPKVLPALVGNAATAVEETRAEIEDRRPADDAAGEVDAER